MARSKHKKAKTGAIPLAVSVVVVVFCGILAYSNTLKAPYLFDDYKNVKNNKSIRSLWPLSGPLRGNRPIAKLSFAVNYAIHGRDVRGYHATNLGIHIVSALLLLGIVRRTLRSESLTARYGPIADRMALAVAVLWLLHPLQTQSVTYIVQRMESMMSMFYLAMLYFLIRSNSRSRAWPWFLAALIWFIAVLICFFLGLLTKEIIITAPVVLLWYDRVFLAKSWKELLRRRGLLYAGLIAPMILAIVWVSGRLLSKNNTLGFGMAQLSWWEYLQTQPIVILHYLRLAIWPDSLCFDYQWKPATNTFQIVASASVLLALIGLCVWAIFKRPALGFLLGSFFVILSPTSSFVPIDDLAVEHRMYLALAPFVILAVVGGYELARRFCESLRLKHSTRRLAVGTFACAVAIALGVTTYARNQVYSSRVTLWKDVLEKAPLNRRGWHNLGIALIDKKEWSEAEKCMRRALELKKKNYPEAHRNMGRLLVEQGRVDEAIEHYLKVVQMAPKDVEVRLRVGDLLLSQKKIKPAIAHFRAATVAEPKRADLHYHYGVGVAMLDPAKAVTHFQRALALDARDVKSHIGLAQCFEELGDAAQAKQCYEQALAVDPRSVEALEGLRALNAKQASSNEV